MEFKDKHYIKSRFNEKEKLLSKFKKDNITKDLHEKKEKTINFINSNYQILKKGESVDFPKKNQITAIRTQSQMNLFSLFLMFIEKYEYIDYLSIQTYTFNEKTLYALKKLLNENKIKKLQILMTETAIFRLPKIYRLLIDEFSKDKRVNLVFYWIHSKINLINCKDNYYVLDGSGNFSMNAQIEHYNIINSKELFNFDKEWQDKFFFNKKLRKNHEIFKNY